MPIERVLIAIYCTPLVPPTSIYLGKRETEDQDPISELTDSLRITTEEPT